MTPEWSSLVRGLQPLADDLASVLGGALALTAEDGRLLLVAGGPRSSRGDAPAVNTATGRIEWGRLRTTTDAETLEAPLRVGGELLGTLWVLPSRAGNLDPTALARLFQRELGAIRARQAEVDGMASELLESYEEINRFYQLAKVFDMAGNEFELSEILLHQALEATGGSGGAILLLDEDAPRIVALAGEVGPPLDERRVPPYAVVGAALERGVASNVGGSAGAPHDQPDRPTIVVPLPIKTRPVGTMIIQRHGAKPFPAGDMKVAQSMCSQAGVFLNNLRQAGRLIEAARVRKEMELAETFQRQLLPEDDFRVPEAEVAAAYLATSRIGGDYYDLLELAPKTICLIVADVSGHSIASGLLMTAARSVARLLVEQGLTPDEVLRRLNDVLYRDLDRSGHFISLCCLFLNVDTWEGSYANAGHNPPLWRSGATKTVKTFDATGPLIGIFDDATFEQERFVMSPGDGLVLYTDGIPEARDQDGTLFGEERLQRLVVEHGDASASCIVDGIMAEVRRHAGRHLADDVTLVVLKAGPSIAAGLERAPGAIGYRVQGTLENVPEIRRWLVTRLTEWHVPRRAIDDLALAVTEVCTNVARHGYGGQGAGDIELELARDPGAIRLCILDTAVAYRPPLPPREPGGELAEGGYGLSLIHKIMDQVRYDRREPIGNRVVLVKRLSGS